MSAHVIGPIKLKRIDAVTYGVVNTPILIRRVDAWVTDDGKPTWDVFWMAVEGEPAIAGLPTRQEAIHEVRKLIFFGIKDQIKGLKDVDEG